MILSILFISTVFSGSVDHDSVDNEYRRQERENLMRPSTMPTATYPGLADLYRLDFTNADITPASRMAAEGAFERESIPPIDIRSLLKKR